LESKSYFIDRGLKYTFVEGSWEKNKFSWVWKSSMTRCFEREGYDVHCTLTDVSFKILFLGFLDYFNVIILKIN